MLAQPSSRALLRPRAFGLRNLGLRPWKSLLWAPRHFIQGGKNPNEQNRMKAEARALLVPCSPLLATTPPARKPLPRSRSAFPRLGPADLGCPELLWMDALPPKLGASGCQRVPGLPPAASAHKQATHTHMHMAFTRRLS